MNQEEKDERSRAISFYIGDGLPYYDWRYAYSFDEIMPVVRKIIKETKSVKRRDQTIPIKKALLECDIDKLFLAVSDYCLTLKKP